MLTESLGKTHPGGTVAVADLDLAVRRGEVLGLLDPNGAGKSTAAGMLTTTVRPTSGRAGARPVPDAGGCGSHAPEVLAWRRG